MRLHKPPRAYAEPGLRAMRTIAAEGGAVSVASHHLMDAAQRSLLETTIDVDALAPITPAELAREIAEPALRRQLVQGMVIMSLADGPPSPEKVAIVERFAGALAVDAAEVRSIRQLADRDMLLFRLDFMRRSHIKDMLVHAYQDGGFLGAVKDLLGFRGYLEDPALAARYHALAGLPEDTLGNHVFRYFQRNGFAMPGEKHGFPEAGVYHDFTHVLSGYDTDSPGEMKIAAFIAGYKKENPFYVILFVTLTFSAGVNMTPLPQPTTRSIFAEEGLADAFFHAVERGSRMTVDLSDRWDHWAWVGKPIDEVRRALGIAP